MQAVSGSSQISLVLLCVCKKGGRKTQQVARDLLITAPLKCTHTHAHKHTHTHKHTYTCTHLCCRTSPRLLATCRVCLTKTWPTPPPPLQMAPPAPPRHPTRPPPSPHRHTHSSPPHCSTSTTSSSSNSSRAPSLPPHTRLLTLPPILAQTTSAKWGPLSPLARQVPDLREYYRFLHTECFRPLLTLNALIPLLLIHSRFLHTECFRPLLTLNALIPSLQSERCHSFAHYTQSILAY